jgi:hypothetical protein
LISNRIFNHFIKFPKDNFIDLSDSSDPQIVQLFFNISRGKSIWMNRSNEKQISNVIHFLEFNSLSALKIAPDSSFNFILKNISSLNSFPIVSIQKIISSHHLSLKNENQLFEFLRSLISENKEYLSFLQYLHFGLIYVSFFSDFINSIHFHELSPCLFDHLKYSFLYNYLIFDQYNTLQNDVQDFLLCSGFIADYSAIYEENQDLNILIGSFSVIFGSIEFEYSDKDTLFLSKEQQDIFRKYSCVHIFNGTLSFLEEIHLFPDNELYVFIPNSIHCISKDFFKGCSSLKFISIPNSVTSIEWSCFEGCSSLKPIIIPKSIKSIGDS